MEERLEYLVERYELAIERIGQIKDEHVPEGEWNSYFVSVAAFLEKISEYYAFVREGGLETADLETLQKWNACLYEDILEKNYEESYANPTYAVNIFGEEYGRLLSTVVTEMRSLIVIATERRLEELVIRLELFMELYAACTCEWQESKHLPEYETLRQIIYWYVSDYTDITLEQWIRSLLVSEGNYAIKVMLEADLSRPEYLYRYGEFVSENELKTAEFMATLPQETIDLMATTYTEAIVWALRWPVSICPKRKQWKYITSWALSE